MNYEYLKFSTILHENYHTVHWGLASSFLGEALSLFGFFGLFFVILLWIYGIYIFNYKIKKSNSFMLLMFFPVFIYITFYIHRIDITFVFGAFKTVLVLYFFVFILVLSKKIINKVNYVSS